MLKSAHYRNERLVEKVAAVEKSVLIAHSAQQMFELVDRCEDYPLFLPWCSKSELLHRDAQTTRATLYIDYRGVKSQFSTENTKEFPSLMRIRLISGPFSKMQGHWRFMPLDDCACKVELYLHYEFSNQLLAKIIGPVFNFIANSFIEAFVKRARQVYGDKIDS